MSSFLSQSALSSSHHNVPVDSLTVDTPRHKEFFLNKNNFLSTIIGNIYKKEKVNITSQRFIFGTRDTNLAFTLVGLFHSLNSNQGSYLIILPTEKEAANLYSDLCNLIGEQNVSFYPELGVLPYEDIAPNRYTMHKRIDSLFRLVNNEDGFVVTSCIATCRYILPKSLFLANIFYLEVKKTYDRDKMICRFEQMGYIKVGQVRDVGEFSVRGGIIDIYSASSDAPVRIDFFDEEIEEMRLFHPESQVSFKSLDHFQVLPKHDNWMPISIMENGLKKITGNQELTQVENQHFDQFREKVTKTKVPGIYNYFSFFYDSLETLIDYLDPKVQVVAVNPFLFTKRLETHFRELQVYHNNKSKQNIIKAPPEKLYARRVTTNAEKIFSYEISSFAETTFQNPNESPGIFFKVQNFQNFKSDIEKVKQVIEKKVESGYLVLVAAGYAEQVKRLAQIFESLEPVVFSEKNTIPPKKNKGLVFIQANFNQGFELAEKKLQLICENEIFGRRKKQLRHFNFDATEVIESFIDLKENDHIVHINHGIGIYRGLKRMEVGGKTKDYLKIEYAGASNLFIPVEQMNLIQKYIGSGKSNLKLDLLGGKAWDKVKQQVKKSVENIAKDLIKLYAKRKKFNKESFPPESYMQTQFEIDFPFEETVDQLKAMEEIKRDMESNQPMDRLLCGDVGFGKTEVAMRAAFKCVMASKQCVFLCPTTILSEQHYNTFLDRFKRFPIDIEVINRFKSSSEQKIILEKVKEGKIDILIGTHRLLSKDVFFNRLGLLVVDEEQKFGVKHKEQIREISEMIDTLTLTATPIPRTLHMSLANIRTISIMNTPPLNRRPVQTFVTEFDENIIDEAMRRELSRGGQAFFLHNRVETIAHVFQFLKKLLPGIKIAVAHGQMNESELENVMNEFMAKKYDLLLATTIIDSGLDIPNANTIFINRVENFGLSQLYQLRGRVGRSDRQGYAYMFYQRDKSPSEDVLKRLQFIVDYVELGSGFKIAMKDLEMRGAGNILGREQSGNIMAVGFDLYCKLLDEVVVRLNHDTHQQSKIEKKDPIIDIKYNGYIANEYIADDKIKIEVYKKIASIKDSFGFHQIKQELFDRFGPLPTVITKLFEISKLRITIGKLGIESMIERVEEFEIKLASKNSLNNEKILKSFNIGEGDNVQQKSKIKLNAQNRSILFLKIPPLKEDLPVSEEFDDKLKHIYLFLENFFD